MKANNKAKQSLEEKIQQIRKIFGCDVAVNLTTRGKKIFLRQVHRLSDIKMFSDGDDYDEQEPLSMDRSYYVG